MDPETDLNWHAQIDLLARANSDIRAIAFFSGQGQCLYATSGALRVSGYGIRQRHWFTEALKQEGTLTVFSNPYVQDIFENQHNFVITLSRAVTYMSRRAAADGCHADRYWLLQLCRPYRSNQAG